MTKEDLEFLVETMAIELGAKEDINFLKAIISTESSWNPRVVRYEDNLLKKTFYLTSQNKEKMAVTTGRYEALTPQIFAKTQGVSIDTEKTFQAMSWGLFQILGLVAREMGCKGNMVELLDPAENIKWGIIFYLKRIKKYLSIEERASAYNRGSPKKNSKGKFTNQKYVDKILVSYRSYCAASKK